MTCENHAHFADFVLVNGNKGFDCGDYIMIHKENATMTVIQRTLSIGDNVTVSFDDIRDMVGDCIVKIYIVTDLEENRVVLRERSFRDFQVFSPNHSFETWTFSSSNEPVPTLKKASAADISEWDSWVYKTYPNLILFLEK